MKGILQREQAWVISFIDQLAILHSVHVSDMCDRHQKNLIDLTLDRFSQLCVSVKLDQSVKHNIV